MSLGMNKILLGAEEALSIVKGDKKPAKVTHYSYVVHSQVDAYVAAGWTRLGVLDGTHHGYYSALCRWDGEGDPKEPANA